MSDAELTNYTIRASRVSPKRTSIDTGDSEFIVGKDVNPVEYFLGAILACLNSTGTMVARDMDIEIQSLEAVIEGGVNYATYQGKDVDDRAGLQDVEVKLSVETQDESDLDAWLAAVKERCPVTDNVENETALTVTLE